LIRDVVDNPRGFSTPSLANCMAAQLATTAKLKNTLYLYGLMREYVYLTTAGHRASNLHKTGSELALGVQTLANAGRSLVHDWLQDAWIVVRAHEGSMGQAKPVYDRSALEMLTSSYSSRARWILDGVHESLRENCLGSGITIVSRCVNRIWTNSRMCTFCGAQTTHEVACDLCTVWMDLATRVSEINRYNMTPTWTQFIDTSVNYAMEAATAAERLVVGTSMRNILTPSPNKE
jgi:hypothetical protein